MKKILLFIVLLCSISLYGDVITVENRNVNSINKTEVDDDGWERWAKVKRAYAYYKSSGERVTDYDYGLDYLDCPVERRVVNGKVQYRIKIMLGGWRPVEKSNKRGYKYCFKFDYYIYYFNM